MNQLKKRIREEEGFTLVELIVVIIIMAILSQIGLVSFNRYTRRTRAFAAETAMRNIKRECEMNRDLGMDQTFTPLTPRGYSLQPDNSNSCVGGSGNGLVSAIPDNQGEYPSYFYNFVDGTIGCNYSSTKDDLFKDCSNGIPNANDSKNDGSLVAVRTNDKGDQIFDGPSCGSESRVQGNYGMESVRGGLHCNCNAKKGETYAYTFKKKNLIIGEAGTSVHLSCYGKNGERVKEKPNWVIPNTDNPGGRSGDNYDWLRYKKWVEDGGRPGEMHSNPIN